LGYEIRHSVGVRLVGVANLPYPILEMNASPLLDDVSQFVREKPTPLKAAWLIMALSENDVAISRISNSAQGSGGLSRPRICMHADTAEVMSESRLHKASRGSV
jgi:hypothetical protein